MFADRLRLCPRPVAFGLAASLLFATVGCGGDLVFGSESPPPSAAVDASPGDDTIPVVGTPVLIVAPEGDDPALERVVATATTYLHQLTATAPAVARMSDADLVALAERALTVKAGLVLVVDAHRVVPDHVAEASLASLGPDGFRLLAEDRGTWVNALDQTTGATFLMVAGDGLLPRQFGVYEALRRLGARFYHPEQEFVPRVPATSVRDRARTPTALARRTADGTASPDYVPDFRTRGYSFHGSHPLEHLEAFSDSNHPIDEAVAVNDWQIKNRANQMRGAGRGVAPPARRALRVQQLEDYRQRVGLRRSTGITLHNEQQGANAAIDPSLPTPIAQQIDAFVADRLEAVPDATHFGVHFGPTEFTVTPDVETVQWIDWVGQAVSKRRPDVPLLINNHTTGSQPSPNYGDLGCPPGTNDQGLIDYYDLAFHTAPENGVSVHTVMFYPLEGPARVYNQRTFAHKLCLMEQASAAGRPLTYFPEGSWWLSFDNPVPVYLPLYIWTRGRDIELLRPLLAARGGGTVDGHRMFNSGHEWGYWQQDYAVGLWHWNADVTMDEVLAELTDPLCETEVWPERCEAALETHEVLLEAMAQQAEAFLEAEDFMGRPGGLYAYFAGEDPADVLGAQTGLEFRPVRVSFADVLAFDEVTAQGFRATDVQRLKEMDEAYASWVARLRAVAPEVPEAGRPWLDEVVDGLEINGLRARQAWQLYEVVLGYRDAVAAREADRTAPPPAEAVRTAFDQAIVTLSDAEQVVRRREARYRYPHTQMNGGGVTPDTGVANGTTYPYRVHTKTHLMTYWMNRHDEVGRLLNEGHEQLAQLRLAPVFALPGQALEILWPALAGLTGQLTMGDGLTAGPLTSSHEYAGEGVFSVEGSYSAEDLDTPVQGHVVRAAVLASSPAGSFTLKSPDTLLGQAVLASIAPAFRWGLVMSGQAVLAFAPDFSGVGKVDFRDVIVTQLAAAIGADGTFETKPVDFELPVPDPATGGIVASVGIAKAVWSGTVIGGALATPLELNGELVLEDVVNALIEMAGYDEKGAYQTLSGIFAFDPAAPPETIPIVAEMPAGPL